MGRAVKAAPSSNTNLAFDPGYYAHHQTRLKLGLRQQSGHSLKPLSQAQQAGSTGRRWRWIGFRLRFDTVFEQRTRSEMVAATEPESIRPAGQQENRLPSPAQRSRRSEGVCCSLIAKPGHF